MAESDTANIVNMVKPEVNARVFIAEEADEIALTASPGDEVPR